MHELCIVLYSGNDYFIHVCGATLAKAREGRDLMV